jgi:hypothetical protein
MERIQTQINGISTASNYQEGDCLTLVNLRPKNGTLHPVAPRKTKQELSQKYDIVFAHNIYDSEEPIWIGIINNDYNSSVYWNIESDQPKNIANTIGKTHNVQQTGNIISLITSDNIYYLLYRNDEYIYLGEIPQIPIIKFGTYHKSIKSYFWDEYGWGNIEPYKFIEATKGLVNKAMEQLVNGYTDKDGDFHEGYGPYFFDACFVRYAFRLYDGTLTKHSPPILIMPARPIIGEEEEGNLDSIKTIFYDFDEVLTIESYVEVYGYKIAMEYDFRSRFDDWKDIIQSIDIFLSPPIGISNIENMRTDMPTSDGGQLKYNLIKGISVDALQNVSNTSSFYFARSIPLGTYTVIYDYFPSTESDIEKMKNLIYQEPMTDDNFSNHRYGSESAYSYNNRLHIANIKTTIFKGFNPDYFLWNNISDTQDGNYNGSKYKDAPEAKYKNIAFEVEINIGTANEKVYQFLYNAPESAVNKMFMSGFISYPDPRAKKLTIYRLSDNKWYKVLSFTLEKHNLLNLSYYISDNLKAIVEKTNPDEATLGNTLKIITLSEPNKLKVSELNNPFNFPNKSTYTISNGKILNIASNATSISEGQFGQYPLYIFTNQGIYSLKVGEGEVVYSSQTPPVSHETPINPVVCSTPFGVVFTSPRGICIIQGQQINLLTPQLRQPPQEINLQTHSKLGGVLLNLSSNFTEFLKTIENMLYNPTENELIIHDKEADFKYIYCFDSQQFYQSTETFDNVVQNTFPDLLVIDEKKIKDYSSSQSPSAHVSLITRPLLFGTPDQKKLERIILRTNLFNIQNPSQEETEEETEEERIKKSALVSYYSIDEVNFRILRGITLDPSNRKDIDLGLFARSKFRQFILAFAGIVDEKSEIRFIETEIEKEYQNTKMR